MLRATSRWLASSVVLLFVVTAATFLLSSLAPGNAAKAILSGQTTSYTQAQYQQVRHELGIDKPLRDRTALLSALRNEGCNAPVDLIGKPNVEVIEAGKNSGFAINAISFTRGRSSNFRLGVG